MAVASLVFVAAWLFLGVYETDEHAEPTIFLKHRPTARFFFPHPLNDSDWARDKTLGDLTPKQRREELAYREFVLGL